MKSDLQFPLMPAAGQNDLPPSDSTTVPIDDTIQTDVPLTPSIAHLPSSGSIQVESDNSGGDEKEPAYQSLEEKDESNALDAFLASLGITQQHLESTGISRKTLLQLYRQEFSMFSGLKWSSFDHLVEKTLQWPLLSPVDVGISDSKRCEYRIRPHERSLLLKSTWGLVKAYAVRGFVQGVELSLLESAHYFIYVMLAYRLVQLIQTGQTRFDDFQDIFRGSSQKGIDSLVQSLAKIEAKWLKLILATPFLIGALQSIAAMYGVRSVSAGTRQETFTKLKTRLSQESDCRHSLMLEEISLLNQRAMGSQIQKLERWVRWDGRLDRQSRQQAFELIRRAAWSGKKVTQIKALESLAKIVHGIGLKDFSRLQRAGRSTEELIELLWMKTTALADLELLSQQKSARHSQFNPQNTSTLIASLPRRLYASYLLWWLGQATFWWTQRLPFSLLKIAKLGLEALFLQKIINSIIEAINCPDKPGYQFGNGYQDWASDYTAKCFTTRISLFRTIDINESVAALVAEIPQYHLTELTGLNLQNKYLTSKEASQIIQAVVQQRASLMNLDLSINQISVIDEDMFNGLSQLNSIDLHANQLSTLSDGVFSGLSQLEYLDLSGNYLTTLSDGVFSEVSQLKSIDLSANRFITLSSGVFNRLSQLEFLGLDGNYIATLNEGIFSGLSQLGTLDLGFNELITLSDDVFSELSQLESLSLSANQLTILSDGAFNGLIKLNFLYLNNNQLTTLSGGIFSGLNQLKSLNLDSNQLKVLSDDVLYGLNQLQFLGLAVNNLNTSMMVTILSQLPSSLTELDISLNPMNRIPQNFSTLLPISLQALSIGGRYVPQTLTREFMQNFPSTLISFSVHSSFIINITSRCFLDFSVLTVLDIGNNRINSLSDGAFNGLSQLEQLYLYNNRLTTLSDSMFSELSQLQSLDLWNNRLTTLNNGVFRGLKQLKSLNLGVNQFSTLNDSTFNGLDRLNELDLDNNILHKLSGSVFGGLSQLNYLYLFYNQLVILSEGIFSGLIQLSNLDLRYNQLNDNAIKNLTQNFPYQLNELYLNNNQIGNEGALTLAEILPCTNLTSIGFSGNPANDTTIASAAQKKALQKVCDDQRCHTNLPEAESCSMKTGSTDSFTEIDNAWKIPIFFDGFATAEIPWLSLALPNGSDLSSTIPATAGALIAGLAVSALLYKNSSWFHGIVNAGCHVLQRGWNSGKAITTKTVSLLNCRSTVFSRASTITRQRSLPLIAETNRSSQNLV